MFREVEGAHHETEKEIIHGLKGYCVIFSESLDQHKSHLKEVLDELNAFGGLVSPLWEVDVKLILTL